MRDHLLGGVQAELLKKLHRRYIPAELDLERLKNDPKAVATLLNEAGDLVARYVLGISGNRFLKCVEAAIDDRSLVTGTEAVDVPLRKGGLRWIGSS